MNQVREDISNMYLSSWMKSLRRRSRHSPLYGCGVRRKVRSVHAISEPCWRCSIMNSFPTTIDRSISANVGVPVERSSGLLQPLNTNRKTGTHPRKCHLTLLIGLRTTSQDAAYLHPPLRHRCQSSSPYMDEEIGLGLKTYYINGHADGHFRAFPTPSARDWLHFLPSCTGASSQSGRWR